MSNYKYEKVYSMIKDDIINNYAVGDILPFDQELADQYSVSLITVKSAMKMLVQDDTLTRKSGARTRVNKIPAEPTYISLIMCAFNSAFGESLVYNFELLCHKYGFIPLVSRTFDKSEIEKKVIKQHIALGTSGIIIQPVDEYYVNDDLDRLYTSKFPLVSIDRPLQNIPCSLVTSNTKSNTSKLIDYMSLTSIENIILIAPLYTFPSSSNNQRLINIMTYAQQKNMNYFTIFTSVAKYKEYTSEWKSKLSELQNNINKYTHLNDVCILCLNYDIAKQTISALEKIDRLDIEVTCFDYPKNLNKVHLTHILQDEKSLIDHSFQNLLIQYNGHTPNNRIEVPSIFIVYDDKVT